MLAQDLLMFMRTVLTATVGMMNAAFGWRMERDSHPPRLDLQISLHPIAASPANPTAGVQIRDDGEMMTARYSQPLRVQT